MQNGLFHDSRATDRATPGEERAWGMQDVSYSSNAQLEDDSYLLPVARKRPSTLIEAVMGFARRLTRH